MKKTFKMIGIIVMTALICFSVFSIIACKEDSEETNQTPVTDDFNIGNLVQDKNNVTNVTITPKSGKSNGSITIYYNGLKFLPKAVGVYNVTFDVAAITYWDRANGLIAGKLMIIETPVGNEYNFSLSSIDDDNVAVELFALNSTINSIESGKVVNLDLSNSTFTTIPQGAFYQSVNLAQITLPETLTKIEGSAFQKCDNLTSVTIGENVTSIGNYAFAESDKLASITIPDSVTSMGTHVFYNCNDLTSVTIGNGLTSIEESVFMYCTKLETVTIGNSVTSIGTTAFSGCTSLESITIPDSVITIGFCAFLKCSKLASIVIPDSVTGIGDNAFADCSGFVNVTIGNSVTIIGDYAFDNCNSLTSVTFEGANTIISPLNAYSPPYFNTLRFGYSSETGGIGTYTRTDKTWRRTWSNGSSEWTID